MKHNPDIDNKSPDAGVSNEESERVQYLESVITSYKEMIAEEMERRPKRLSMIEKLHSELGLFEELQKLRSQPTGSVDRGKTQYCRICEQRAKEDAEKDSVRACAVCSQPFEIAESVRSVNHDEGCNFVHGKCMPQQLRSTALPATQSEGVDVVSDKTLDNLIKWHSPNECDDDFDEDRYKVLVHYKQLRSTALPATQSEEVDVEKILSRLKIVETADDCNSFRRCPCCSAVQCCTDNEYDYYATAFQHDEDCPVKDTLLAGPTPNPAKTPPEQNTKQVEEGDLCKLCGIGYPIQSASGIYCSNPDCPNSG